MFKQSPVGEGFSSFLHNHPTPGMTLMSFSQGGGRKLRHTPREVHNLTIKKSQTWIHTIRWMNLRGTLPSKRSHLYDLLEQTQSQGPNQSVLGWLPGGWGGAQSPTAKGQQEDDLGSDGTIPYYGQWWLVHRVIHSSNPENCLPPGQFYHVKI